MCNLDQHNKLLAQFTSTKQLRVGYQGDSLIISPYNDEIKGEMKKEIVKILGTKAVKKS